MRRLVLALTLLAAPAMAENLGDESLVSICRQSLETVQVSHDGTPASAKKTKSGQELALARAALAAGNATLCAIHADRAESALR